MNRDISDRMPMRAVLIFGSRRVEDLHLFAGHFLSHNDVISCADCCDFLLSIDLNEGKLPWVQFLNDSVLPHSHKPTYLTHL